MNERWLASVTYADNGAYNRICPKDHGLSYLVIGDARVLLRDAIAACGELLLGRAGRGTCCRSSSTTGTASPTTCTRARTIAPRGSSGKPESYYFPEELNVDRNAFPATPMGVDPAYTDRQVLSHLRHYFKGDNRLTDLANTINLVPGHGVVHAAVHAARPRLARHLRAAGGLRRELHPREPGERRGDAAGPARPGPAREGGRGRVREGLRLHPLDDPLPQCRKRRQLPRRVLPPARGGARRRGCLAGVRHLPHGPRERAAEPRPLQREEDGRGRWPRGTVRGARGLRRDRARGHRRGEGGREAGRARRLREPVPGSGHGARGRAVRRRGRGVLVRGLRRGRGVPAVLPALRLGLESRGGVARGARVDPVPEG